MHNNIIKLGLLATATALGTATLFSYSAQAETPSIEITISAEVESDYTHDSDDKSAEINDLFVTIEPAITVNLTNGFSIQSGLTIEPVKDPSPFKDREFRDTGLYVETLFFNYETGNVNLFVGKIDPTFGTAWDAAPGIYGTGIAEDYQLTERIGGGFSYKMMPSGGGEHLFTASAFFADTTFLSNSIITKRGRTRRSDGGASNTGDPSFSITLDGSELPSMPGVSYHLGVRYQQKGRGDAGNETGFVAGMQKEFDLGNEQKIAAIFEVAHLKNQDGGADNASYATLGATYTTGPWNVAVSGTLRHIDVDGGSNVKDHLLQVSGGYEFNNGVTLDVGYKNARESKIDSHTVGILLTKEFSFSR